MLLMNIGLSLWTLSLTRSYHPSGDERGNKDVVMESYNKRRYTFYPDDKKTRFFHLFF
jgi:hypothetical protein